MIVELKFAFIYDLELGSPFSYLLWVNEMI